MRGGGARDVLGKPPDLKLGSTEHFRDVVHRRASLIRVEAAHNGLVMRAISPGNNIHHVVFAVVRETNVDVRQFVERHPLAVEEAPGIQLKTDRADAGDAECVTGERGGSAATGDSRTAATPKTQNRIVFEGRLF